MERLERYNAVQQIAEFERQEGKGTIRPKQRQKC